MSDEEKELILAQDKAQDKAQDEIVNEKISNMNEEEKKAVDKINKLVEYLRKWNENFTIVPTDIKYFEKILSLVEKQQKEIEDLKTVTREYDAYEMGEGNKIMIASKEWFNNGYFKEHYISKDKIRDIILEFIPKSNHEVELRTKIIKLLGE